MNINENLEKMPIDLDKDRCSKCLLCISVCPFDAISRDGDGELEIAIEECKLCGICAGICPSLAIDIIYYDYRSLVDYVEKRKKELKTKNVVVTCRGSCSPFQAVEEVLREHDVNLEEFVHVRLPCVGRLPPVFYFQIISLGVRKTIVVKCKEDFCRFEEGSTINTRWFPMLSKLLEQFGYAGDMISLVRNSLKATYDTEECVGCDKCEYICPYDAIEVQPLATPEVNMDECQGCGACAFVCSEMAMQLDGFEHEAVRSKVQEYKKEAERMKSEGLSPRLAFYCQWAEFSSLAEGEEELARKDTLFLEIPCLCGLDLPLVIDALGSFDKVAAVVCPEEECKHEEGRGAAERSILSMKRILNRMKMEERFKILEVSPKTVGEFNSKLDSFIYEK